MSPSSRRAVHDGTVKIVSDILKKVRNSGPSKTPAQLERHVKGIANHRRIAILIFLAKHDGATLDQISGALNCNFKTTAEHTRRLHQAGLINKKYIGRNVGHSLSPYGKIFFKFLQSF